LNVDDTVLPPMLIQPFIENAIWHGVSANNPKININVAFMRENDHLTCVIDDNGIGIEQSKTTRKNGDPLHSSYGIANIRNRIRLLNEKYDLRSDITITDKKNRNGSAESGTIVTLHLPLEINEE
jgi:sensor histidine kinase YesM